MTAINRGDIQMFLRTKAGYIKQSLCGLGNASMRHGGFEKALLGPRLPGRPALAPGQQPGRTQESKPDGNG